DAHLQGILNHADHPISSGKLEGTNNLIKTIRRKAYGFQDTQYFFLKIMEASRRPKARYQSHKKMS
ncbi:MAG: transposase, partial [Sphaerochaeta sp.]|nr:transposase [Sphaerochaeta sp.]MEA5032646.1 transposase [Sphaerochaeta sp.]